MSKGTAKARREKSENSIIFALLRADPLNKKNQKLSWGQLLKETGLSRRTLSLRLEDLKKNGKINRIVDISSEEYPPPVYYELNPKTISRSIIGLEDYRRKVEQELTFKEKPELFIKKFSNIISPLVIYIMLRSIGSTHIPSMDVFLNQIWFTLKKYFVFQQDFDKSDLKLLASKFIEINEKPEKSRKEIDKLIKALEKIYPKEMVSLKRIYVPTVKRPYSKGSSLKISEPEKSGSQNK